MSDSDFDIDSLLDATLDDLEDLPEFKPYPPGAHRVLASLEVKEVSDKKAVELSFKGIETLDLVESTKDEPIKEGDQASILFMLDNEYGRGNMKKLLRPIAEALGTATNRETIEQCKELEVVILTSYRKNKEDPTAPYMNVKDLQVV